MLEYSDIFFLILICDNMIEINYEIIKNNIRNLGVNDYVVLKSNAYGFGFCEVLDIAINEGMTKFCVIDLNDAIYIKNKYPFAIVLLLGVFNKLDIDKYEMYEIDISINDLDELLFILDRNINIQLAVNTGMNRFGVRPYEIDTFLKLIKNSDLKLTGVYSHNATQNYEFINSQLEAFFYVCKELSKELDIHYASSSLIGKKIKFANCCRIGDALYYNAFSIFGKIVKINYVEKDEFIGYGYSYRMRKNSYIGIIDIGYADGLERNSNGFLVYINNKYYHLIGKACMNYSFVLLDDKVRVGDKVHFISPYNNIINYEKFFGKCSHEIYMNFLKK